MIQTLEADMPDEMLVTDWVLPAAFAHNAKDAFSIKSAKVSWAAQVRQPPSFPVGEGEENAIAFSFACSGQRPARHHKAPV